MCQVSLDLTEAQNTPSTGRAQVPQFPRLELEAPVCPTPECASGLLGGDLRSILSGRPFHTPTFVLTLLPPPPYPLQISKWCSNLHTLWASEALVE